jgi:hypothetical protein
MMKKAVIFFSVFLAIIFVMGFLPWAINVSTIKENKFNKMMAESPLLLMTTYERGESVLYYIDRSAELALREVIYKYSNTAGLNSNCEYKDGYYLWNNANQNCWPQNVKDSMAKDFRVSLNNYFAAYPEKIPEIDYTIEAKDNSLIGKTDKRLRMDITEGDVFNFKVDDEPKVSDDTPSEVTNPSVTPPVTPPVENPSSDTCTYCFSDGFEYYWKSEVQKWDPDGADLCGNAHCCTAKCPPNSKILDVPYFNQCDKSYGHTENYYDACDSMCGPTSVKMVNDYYGGSFSLDEWNLMKYGLYDAAGWAPMTNTLSQKTGKSFSQYFTNDESFIKTKLDQGKPLVTGIGIPENSCPTYSPYTYYCPLGGMGHVSTIVGYSSVGFILNDPYTNVKESPYFSSHRLFGHHIVIPFSSYKQLYTMSLIAEI